MGAPYRFYAADVSYFSGKVRPALRVKGVDYEEIPASAEAFREVILPRTGLGFIPVVVTPDDVALQDTSVILDELERREPEPALYPATPVQRVVAYLIEIYADEFMLLPAMHYRWSFPESEAKARADFVAVNGDEQAAQAFADRMKSMLPPLGVTQATAPAIEAHLAELLDALSAHFGEHDYLLGDRMSLADCALMGPMYAHLYVDAAPGRLLRERAPRACEWIERMNAPPPQGDFLPGDTLAPTLRPVLELIGADAVPMLLDGMRAFEAWADEHRGDAETPPRGVGRLETSLRGVPMPRYASSYTPWMLQRAWDACGALSDAERKRVDEALAGTGCEALLAYAPRHRLAKQNFKLVFAA